MRAVGVGGVGSVGGRGDDGESEQTLGMFGFREVNVVTDMGWSKLVMFET